MRWQTTAVSQKQPAVCCCTVVRMAFTFLKVWQNQKKKNILWHDVKFAFQYYRSSPGRQPHRTLWLFHTPSGEVSLFNRDHMACKTWNTPWLALYRTGLFIFGQIDQKSRIESLQRDARKCGTLTFNKSAQAIRSWVFLTTPRGRPEPQYLPHNLHKNDLRLIIDLA